jgi:branched-chain amino acid transport system ATP-binding protein
MTEPTPLLEVDGLSIAFGGVPALADVRLSVPGGSVVALIGPNGAGKSTLFNCVSRLYRPAAGTVRYDGADLLTRRANELAGLGIARTFQSTALFAELTVRENLQLGVPDRASASPLRAMLRATRRKDRETAERAGAELARWGLDRVADVPASGLDYPSRKRVELARALMAEPRLLLLDEPAAGLASGEAVDFGTEIAEICAAAGTTVLLVEHNVAMVMRIAVRIAVLAAGRNLAEGTPAEIAADPEVARVFLGSAAGAVT